MKPFKRTLIELFGEKRRYIVPLYQRKYAWTAEPNLRLLWEDVLNAVSQINVDRTKITPHFMGAMVIAQKKTFGQAVPAFEVIDGQQRLTTIQLFLLAFRDTVASASPEYEAELNRYILNDGIMADSAQERYKLWPTITDRRRFVQIVDPDVETDGTLFDLDVEEGAGELIEFAYEFFSDRIRSHVFDDDLFDKVKTAHLFEALKDYLAIVAIELEEGDDPQTIFETLNSRGVDLTQSDLIRNLIFQRAAAQEMEDGTLVSDRLYSKYWLPLDRAFWAETESRGRQTLPRLDWMLTDYLSMQQRKVVSSTHLATDYRKWSKQTANFESIEEELSEIFAVSINAKRLISQKQDDCLGRFGQLASIFDTTTMFPLVLYLAKMAKSNEILAECLTHLESYIVRRDICRLTTKNYNNVFIDVLKNLEASEGDIVENLAVLLRSGTSETNLWPSDDLFALKWEREKQYRSGRQKRLVYVLTNIELALASGFSEAIEIKGALSVEHIMPQSWQAHWPLEVEDDPDDELSLDGVMAEVDRENAINTLGNLTLLTQKLNASVSNGPFQAKLAEINTHSRLSLNLELQSHTDWTEETIKSRARTHAQLAIGIWRKP